MSSQVKLNIFILSIFLLISLCLSTSIINYDVTHNIISSSPRTNNNVKKIYESWVVKHQKHYNTLGENEKRFESFKDNLKFINEYKLELNKFADLSNHVFGFMFFGQKRKPVVVVVEGQCENDEKALQKAVANHQRISVAIADGGGRDFHLDDSGVSTESVGPLASTVACDSYNSCPSRSTCCCTRTYGPYCFEWGCCQFESAVCCDDHSSCCPKDRPICNTAKGTCSSSKNSPLSIKALKRTPAILTAKSGLV